MLPVPLQTRQQPGMHSCFNPAFIFLRSEDASKRNQSRVREELPCLTLRNSGLPLAISAIGLALTLGCNSGNQSLSLNNENGNSIIGAGSTFIYPIMTRWVSDFQSTHQGVKINYQSIGSGGGIQQLKRGLVDFGASDAALDDQQLSGMPPLVQIPERRPGLHHLQFT
jgi:phosphate transport system substrate-binding protein